MNDALLVGGLQCFGNLLAAVQGLFDRHGFAFEAFAQGLAFDQLHDQGMGFRGFLNAVDGGDVRVVQCGQRVGFAFEASYSVSILRKGFR